MSSILEEYKSKQMNGFDMSSISIKQILNNPQKLLTFSETAHAIQDNLSSQTASLRLLPNYTTFSQEEIIKKNSKIDTLAEMKDILDFIKKDNNIIKYSNKSNDDVKAATCIVAAEMTNDIPKKNFYNNQAVQLIMTKNLSFQSINTIAKNLQNDFKNSEKKIAEIKR